MLIAKKRVGNTKTVITKNNLVTLKPVDAPKKTLLDLFNKFDPISLESTNKSAEMLKRFDNKYVMNRTQFTEFLSLVLHNFSVLEINSTRQFSYTSCYYDDNYRCYYDHHQDKRRRFKVRTREYVDSGLMFFEVKLKGLRGQTDKHRIPTKKFSDKIIKDDEEFILLKSAYEENYKAKYLYNLKPALIVDYRRCTLVAKQGGERVTIDFSLAFTPYNGNQKKIQISENFIIIETKSGDGKGLADKVMKQLGIRQASKCSKYCLGVNLSGEVKKSNNFLPMIRRISKDIISGKQLFKNR